MVALNSMSVRRHHHDASTHRLLNDKDSFSSLACEGHRALTESHGTLHSPNYPCYYGGGQDCRWTIEPQVNSNSVQAIWIKFNTFYLNYATSHCWSVSCYNCQYSKLSLIRGISSNTLLLNYRRRLVET